MANLPRQQLCWSESNLTSFLAWYKWYASPQEQSWAAVHLYSVEHRSIHMETPSPIVLQRANGVQTFLPRRACNEEGCARCRSGKGGWFFRWTDARWTPIASLDLDLNPRTHIEQSSRDWPFGVRTQPPQQHPTPVVGLPPAVAATTQPAPLPGSSAVVPPGLQAAPELTDLRVGGQPSQRSSSDRASGSAQPRELTLVSFGSEGSDTDWSEADSEENELLWALATSRRVQVALSQGRQQRDDAGLP